MLSAEMMTEEERWSSAFADLTSGTNTTAAMVVGTGASLGFPVRAQLLLQTLFVQAVLLIPNLPNSSITVNTSGILSGGGSVALGGTLNFSCN